MVNLNLTHEIWKSPPIENEAQAKIHTHTEKCQGKVDHVNRKIFFPRWNPVSTENKLKNNYFFQAFGMRSESERYNGIRKKRWVDLIMECSHSMERTFLVLRNEAYGTCDTFSNYTKDLVLGIRKFMEISDFNSNLNYILSISLKKN